MLRYEFLHGNRLVDRRDCSLERLFGSADKDLFHSGCLQDASLGMVSDDRGQLVESHLACLLCKPLVAVVVLGRAYCQVQSVWVRAPSFLAAEDHGLDSLVAVRGYAASMQRAAAVDDCDFIAASVPEHLDAVA